jgi:hypothetical protein
MTVDGRVQRSADPKHVLEAQFAAERGASNDAGRVPIAREVTGNSPNRDMDEKDSFIYDFHTYAEGEEGIRLLIQDGFDRMDLWLVGKGLVFESAWKAGPHKLMMHGNSAEASKAHDVLAQHTNRLIEECLRFR